MNLGAFSPILSLLYSDKMAVKRHQTATNPDGTTYNAVPDAPLYDDISCRISFSSSDNSETNQEDSNPIRLEIKVFCSPTVDIKKGDIITAKRLSDNGEVLETYTGIANLPFMYVTHQEIRLTQVGDA